MDTVYVVVLSVQSDLSQIKPYWGSKKKAASENSINIFCSPTTICLDENENM